MSTRRAPPSLSLTGSRGERERLATAIGILLGSEALRKRLLSADRLPGVPTRTWRLLRAIARRPEKAAWVLAPYEDDEFGPAERILRHMQREELEARLRMSQLKLSRYLKDSLTAAEAAEEAQTCQKLIRALQPLARKLAPQDKSPHPPEGA